MSASPSDAELCDNGGSAWGPATLLSALVHALALGAALAVVLVPEPDPVVPPSMTIELVMAPVATAGVQPVASVVEPAAPVAVALNPPPQPATKRRAVSMPVPAPAAATVAEGAAPAAAAVAAGDSGRDAAVSRVDTPGVAAEADAVTAYLAEIRARLQRVIVYPGKARRVGLHGMVWVRFRIQADGGVQAGSLRIRDDGVHPLLMAGAEDTVMAASLPAPPLPFMDVDVPLVFRLDQGEPVRLAHSGR